MYQGAKWILLKQKNEVKNLMLGHLSENIEEHI
jgi:hypothetical protein